MQRILCARFACPTIVRHSLFAYSTSLSALILALLARWALDPILGSTLPLVTLFGAVAFAVWVGGCRCALAVAVVGYLACNYLFITPRGGFGPVDAQTLIGLVTYIVTCLCIVSIGAAMRRAQASAWDRGEWLTRSSRPIGPAASPISTPRPSR